jgi:hypothetical protein
MTTQSITLTASASYGNGGKQFIARITGPHPKFHFEREFIGSKGGKRDEYSSAEVDEPGLYQARSIDKKGGSEDDFIIVWMDGDDIKKDSISESEARKLAKKADDMAAILAAGRKARITLHESRIANSSGKDPDGMVRLDKATGPFPAGEVRRGDLIAWRQAEIERLSAKPASPVDAAVEAIMAALAGLDEKSAAKALAAAKKRISAASDNA